MFGIGDDILIAGFSDLGRDHDIILDMILRLCKEANLRLNSDKCLFRCPSIPFFWEIIPWSSVSPDPRNVQALMDMPPAKCRKELQLFLCLHLPEQVVTNECWCMSH